jgi:O6-methylguanine-DNA--protein-cysteine methyltransferase
MVEKVYAMIKKISKGKTLSYKEVVILAEKPKVFRVVGNPLT